MRKAVNKLSIIKWRGERDDLRDWNIKGNASYEELRIMMKDQS